MILFSAFRFISIASVILLADALLEAYIDFTQYFSADCGRISPYRSCSNKLHSIHRYLRKRFGKKPPLSTHILIEHFFLPFPPNLPIRAVYFYSGLIFVACLSLLLFVLSCWLDRYKNTRPFCGLEQYFSSSSIVSKLSSMIFFYRFI